MDETLSNFIPVSRKLFDHPFWKEKRIFSKLEAWLDLIASARFEGSEATELIDGKMISWTRGQLPASLRYLAERWQWSKHKVDNFIRLLENEQMVERQTSGGQSILSIRNYETYNGGQQRGQLKRPLYDDAAEGGDSRKDRRRTVRGHGGDKTNKENKENKEEYNLYRATGPVYSEDDKVRFKQFEEWILKNTPRVGMMNQPFTIDQYIRLGKTLPREQVRDLLYAMQNSRPLLKNNESAYLTILNWAKRDYNRLKPATNATSDTATYLRKREDQAAQVRKRAES